MQKSGSEGQTETVNEGIVTLEHVLSQHICFQYHNRAPTPFIQKPTADFPLKAVSAA